MPLTHEFYELHEMLKLTIHVQESGENGRDVITFEPSGEPTEIERRLGDRIRKSVVSIACARNAVTKYEKGGVLDPHYRKTQGLAQVPKQS